MRLIAPAAALAAALLAAGCEGESFSAGAYPVDGEWRGQARVITVTGTPAVTDTTDFEVFLRLTQNENAIDGEGEIRTEDGDTAEIGVSGTYAFPSVDLVLGGDAVIPTLYDGQFDVDTLINTSVTPNDTQVVTRNDSIVGRLNGSGLSNVQLNIARLTPLP
jgi:hypothetical protein